MVDATQRLSAGDLSARTGAAHGQGELAQLASAFDHMAESLERREAERRIAEEALREREEQYRSIFESTSDGLIINDLEGRVVEANPAMCRMHGYTREEFIGMNTAQFVHPDHHYLIAEYLRHAHSGDVFKARAVNIRKDGTTFDVEVRGSRLAYQGQPHMMGVVRDVTEQVRAYQMLEERVVERTRELATLLEVSHSVASMLDLKPLLGLILDQLFKMVEYHGATIFTLDGDDLAIMDYRGPIPWDRAMRIRLPLDRAAVNREVIRRREPILIGDVRGTEPLAREFQATAGDQLETTFGYIRSWMGIPLLIKEWVVGMLSIDHSEPNFYTPRHAKLALAIATQAAVAIENARLYEQAQALAALEERQKLARELHDSVSQALYGIALGARTARTLLDRDTSRVAEPLDYVMSLAEAGLAEMRALIFELRPESLETEGLVVALTKQAASLRARHNLDVRVDLCAEPDLPLDVKVALYRVAQEAQNNIVKHARAQQVEVRLQCDRSAVTLDVCDDGVGFDPDGAFPGHLGLRSMRERVERLGGTLQIESAPGKGARIQVRLSLDKR
jgi:PAS domain S-box-containing protein